MKIIVSNSFQSASKNQLVNAIIAVKATLIDDGGNMSCIAPLKHIWNSTGSHEINIMYERGWKKNEVYYSLLQDVKMGVSLCNDSECDWCNEDSGGLPYGTNVRDCIVLNGQMMSGRAL